jgi:hypothetical protein
MKHDDIQKHKSTNEFPWWKPVNFKVGDAVEIIGGYDFMIGKICKVIAISHDKFDLFPIRVESDDARDYVVYPVQDLKLIKAIDDEDTR